MALCRLDIEIKTSNFARKDSINQDGAEREIHLNMVLEGGPIHFSLLQLQDPFSASLQKLQNGTDLLVPSL